jgi:outer membrane protein assembly factor BamB
MPTMRQILLLFAVTLVLGSMARSDQADNWPQFRGTAARGISDNPNLPERWSDTENVVWKVPVPGRGWSSPIVWENQVYLTTVVSEGELEEAKRGLYFGGERKTPPTAKHQWKLLCLDLATGDLHWDRVAHEGLPESTIHLKNSYASETPATDGHRVYAYFGNQGLYAYDPQGNLLWSKKIGPYKTRFGWGTGASPIAYQGRVFLVNDNDQESFVIALDGKTGAELWRQPRDEKSNWATPFIWQNELRTELVTSGTNKVRSYDLDGNLLWELGGMSSIAIPTPFAEHGLLYLSSGYIMDKTRPVFAVRPGASGDISPKEGETRNEYVAWFQPEAGPYNPSPVLYKEYLYVLLDRGMLACYDAKTGAEVYSKKRLPNGRAFTSSPWAYNDKIFCLNEFGATFVIKAGPEFELLYTNELPEDTMCMATPAIAGDKLLLRTDTHLYCIGKTATTGTETAAAR